MKILLVDDHAIIRDGIKALLSLHDNMEIIGEASEGKEAIVKAEELKPDLIIMDIGMAGMDGLEATRRICKKNPDTKVLILTQHENKDYVLASIKAGAKGYLPKKAVGSDLITAIGVLSRGESFLYPAAASVLMDGFREKSMESDPYDTLTAREREILKLVAEGKTSKQIAGELVLSIKTVVGHRLRIMEKLDIHNKAELIKFAMRKGLIQI